RPATHHLDRERILEAGWRLRGRELSRSLVLDRRSRSAVEGRVHLPADPHDAGRHGRKAPGPGADDSGELRVRIHTTKGRWPMGAFRRSIRAPTPKKGVSMTLRRRPPGLGLVCMLWPPPLPLVPQLPPPADAQQAPPPAQPQQTPQTPTFKPEELDQLV